VTATARPTLTPALLSLVARDAARLPTLSDYATELRLDPRLLELRLIEGAALAMPSPTHSRVTPSPSPGSCEASEALFEPVYGADACRRGLIPDVILAVPVTLRDQPDDVVKAGIKAVADRQQFAFVLVIENNAQVVVRDICVFVPEGVIDIEEHDLVRNSDVCRGGPGTTLWLGSLGAGQQRVLELALPAPGPEVAMAGAALPDVQRNFQVTWSVEKETPSWVLWVTVVGAVLVFLLMSLATIAYRALYGRQPDS
jgi:hypothetical protein